MESLFKSNLTEFNVVYCLDGIMIPKSMFDGEKTVEGFLQCVHSNIVIRFGDCYERVRFIDKPMNDAWTINTEEHKTEYDKMKDEFEKDNKHFYMIETKKYYRKITKQDGSIFYIEHTKTEFKDALAHLQFKQVTKEGIETKDFIPKWLKDENRLQYKNFTFDLQGNTNKDYLNLWTGFDIINVEPLEAKTVYSLEYPNV